MGFLNLPPEVQLLVLRFLDLPDLLQVRLICRTLSNATYERTIWMWILQEQERYLPLPPELVSAYRSEDEHLRAYSTSVIESTVTSAQRTADAWSQPRSGVPTKIKREGGEATLMGLDLFLDRWLVALYFEGGVYLYDTYAAGQSSNSRLAQNTRRRPVVLRSSLSTETSLWTSYSLQLDCSCKILFLALSQSTPLYKVQIYKVDLDLLASDSLQNGFRLIQTIDLPFSRNIYGIDTTQRMIALSGSGVVEVLKWEESFDPFSRSHERTVIKSYSEDLEGLWNGVIAIRFVGEYLLLFKTRTLEVHRYSSPDHPGISSEGPPFAILKHTFSMTFRNVSFSQATMSRNPVSEAETHELTVFAYDVIQGLFHYTIRIVVPLSTEMPPSLDVHLTGVYPLSVGIASTNIFVGQLPQEAMPSGTISSRGFLSTHSLGLQGKRAVWVERKRSSTTREVHVWSREKSLVEMDGPVQIERNIVYSSESYDLRDDITHCTFGELNGRIFLGYRSGDISFLDIN